MYVSQTCKLALSPIPRIASTSLIHWLFALTRPDNLASSLPQNRALTIDGQNVRRYIARHNEPALYRATKFSIPDDFFAVVVVRDPVHRFLSSYRDRVVHKKNLGEKKLKRLGHVFIAHPYDPDINYLAQNLRTYFGVRDVKNHFDRFHKRLGDDITKFHIYRLEEIPRLHADMARHLSALRGEPEGAAAPMATRLPPHLHDHRDSGEAGVTLASLTEDSLEALITFHARDYELFGFDPDAIRSEWKAARTG